jgi:hypothetical protein
MKLSQIRELVFTDQFKDGRSRAVWTFANQSAVTVRAAADRVVRAAGDSPKIEKVAALVSNGAGTVARLAATKLWNQQTVDFLEPKKTQARQPAPCNNFSLTAPERALSRAFSWCSSKAWPGTQAASVFLVFIAGGERSATC